MYTRLTPRGRVIAKYGSIGLGIVSGITTIVVASRGSGGNESTSYSPTFQSPSRSYAPVSTPQQNITLPNPMRQASTPTYRPPSEQKSREISVSRPQTVESEVTEVHERRIEVRTPTRTVERITPPSTVVEATNPPVDPNIRVHNRYPITHTPPTTQPQPPSEPPQSTAGRVHTHLGPTTHQSTPRIHGQ
jgi:hypothetical protein